MAEHEHAARLSKIPEADRPGLVIFVVMTDGEETSSREFPKAALKTLIQRQTDQYPWQFTFLGADHGAFAEAEALGILRAGAASLAFAKVGQAYADTGNKVARMRRQLQQGEKIDNTYTLEERQDMS